MIRYCHRQGCDKPVKFYVKGIGYCRDHKPVVFTEEDVRKHKINEGVV